MTEFHKPTNDTLLPILKMELTPAQTDAKLVAPNAVTLAQAAYYPPSEVWGIWEGETPVGLVALVDGSHPEADLEEGDDPNALLLWRLFIDKTHQGKGHGTKALEFVTDLARKKGLPKVYTSAVQHEFSARPLYERFGFKPTGRVIDGDEDELVYSVT